MGPMFSRAVSELNSTFALSVVRVMIGLIGNESREGVAFTESYIKVRRGLAMPDYMTSLTVNFRKSKYNWEI